MYPSNPLHWIVDGLDECDTPRAFLDILRSLQKCNKAVHIFITSRKTETLTSLFNRQSDISVETIDIRPQETIQSDIRMVIENDLQFMRGSDELRLEVMESILERADGNHLWVRLVLDQILRCHTTQAMRRTLDELPAGMEAVYRQMVSTIVEGLSKEDVSLAIQILKWTACAYRPLTLEELSQALMPDYPEFLDFKATVQEVCGQFICIDNAQRVTLVHRTARDFLTKVPDTELYINQKDTHAELYHSAIICLLRPGLRSQLASKQQTIRSREPLLLYASTSFMYHLRHAASNSDHIMNTLVEFLEGSAVLSWIHILALFNRLDTLLVSARTLTWFIDLNSRLNAQKSPLLHRLQDLELFETWAVDLVKIVAKFGRHLLEEPTVIYKNIPAVCPPNSMIAHQFNAKEGRLLSVSGISDANWNDCLARYTLLHGIQAWKLICTGRYIAILTSAKRIVLVNADNFQELCTMHHDEFVQNMCSTSDGKKLVSYGFRSTKLWNLPSGDLTATIPNPINVKALAIAPASNDTKVMIGSDDKRIWELDLGKIDRGWHGVNPALLHEASPIEGGIITSPSFIGFNSDATKVAIAYRGYPLSVWSTQEHHLFARCRRNNQHRSGGARPSVGWMAVDRVAWSPVADVLVGLYKDGTVFKWDPIREEHQEAQTVADEIQVSPDGKLFITSDSSGIIQVWNFAYLTVIYKLGSNNMVTGLAFSPSCSRFYDMRGSVINAWEPNSLVRFSDHSETNSDTTSDYQNSSNTTLASEYFVASMDPITAFGSLEDGSFYSAAHESGTTDFFHKAKGKIFESEDFSTLFSIDQLTWGKGGKYIAAAGLGGTIIIKSTDLSDMMISKPHSLQTIKAKLEGGGIQQMLFSTDATKLLIVSQKLCQIWNVQSGQLLLSSAIPHAEDCCWLNHPMQAELIVSFGNQEVQTVSWEDMAVISTFKLEQQRAAFESSPDQEHSLVSEALFKNLSVHSDDKARRERRVHKAMVTQDGKHVLVQSTETLGLHVRKPLAIFKISRSKDPGSCRESITDQPLEIPSKLLTRIEVALGVLAEGRFVFLDKDLWMCTIRLDSLRDTHAVKRHYFIPRDWASPEGLEQCCVLPDGTLLMPKDGEVIAISSGIAEELW